MSMIQVSDLAFAYESSGDPIFDRVSFQIDTDWKLGFIGRNGRGKTTFFHLLMGKYEYGGTISASVSFDYFPYEVPDRTKRTEEILREVCPAAEGWELLRELALLEVEAEVLPRPFGTLSNGERTKVLLAALFLNEGHFLLIDEPTNHLDTEARKLVAAYLRRKKGFILVSHDRAFLDGCIDHVLSLNKTNIEVQSGNFSSWWENKRRQDEYELAQDARLKKDIGRLRQSADRSANWSDQVEKSKKGTTNSGSKLDKGYVGHKAAKMMKRSKAIEDRQQQAAAQKAQLLRNTETCDSLKLAPLVFHSERFIEFSDVSLYYGERRICGPVRFTLDRGERLAINGRNGSGKSSILKLILGERLAYTGSFSVSSQLVISTVPQDTSHLRGSLTDYARAHQLEESLFKAILRKMDFERVQFEKNMEDFSGGQKKKVLIAASLCERAHLYIWDEPLNFVDVYSRMQIEELIRSFQPTMIFVEHDRAFQQKIATKILTL